MNIKIHAAIRQFFPKPTFNMIYSEALANALDAGASKVKISVSMESFTCPQTLRLKIEDDGEGFTDENFEKFSNLLETKDKNHKGLGRLTYLNYFKNVSFKSDYGSGKQRRFVFSEDFEGKEETVESDSNSKETVLEFSEFYGERLRTYDDVVPESIVSYLKRLFLPRFFSMKKQNQKFQLEVSLITEKSKPEKNFVNGKKSFTLDELPELEEIQIKQNLDVFQSDLIFSYHIDTEHFNQPLITALCVDGRTLDFPLKNINIPQKVSGTCLLSSPYFDAKTNESRQELTLDGEMKEIVRSIFTENIAKILQKRVPEINERNSQIKEKLVNNYPHLQGYFDDENIVLMDEDKTLEKAQQAFFKEQKEILSAESLTDEQYEKSLNQATRVLTEYILYRNRIIKKLSEIDNKSSEANIHNLIVPMRQIFKAENIIGDLYKNNAWLLDDKYMSYQYVLSDKTLQELIEKISNEEERQDDLRPDIALVFSDDVNAANHPVDVIIVELKKKSLNYLKNMTVIEQIKQRARRLLALYPNKIQRMWFFGIVDFDSELLVEMEESWIPLYSSDKVFYQEMSLLPQSMEEVSTKQKHPVSVTLLSFEALWKDAQIRNETFLKILKESIKRTSNNH